MSQQKDIIDVPSVMQSGLMRMSEASSEDPLLTEFTGVDGSQQTNREAHEEAAGMNLCDSFFTISRIDPEAPYIPTSST